MQGRGDCLTYAVCVELGEILLFKESDFAQTDIPSRSETPSRALILYKEKPTRLAIHNTSFHSCKKKNS
jgi:hypothetical protein